MFGIINKVQFLSSILMTGCCASACAQQVEIIFRGDDMGFSHSANLACIDAYQDGIVRSVEVIVPGPWFEESVKMLKENPNLDVGVHLVLTSEWENIKWRPLTNGESISDENGYFYPIIWPNEKYPDQALLDHEWDIEEVEAELRAQIELAKRRIPQLSHLTGHMGCTNINDQIRDLTNELSEEYGLVISLEKQGFVQMTQWAGKEFTADEKRERLIGVLRNLKPGKYLSVAHPAYLSAETENVYHIGYENVGSDRDGETKALTNSEVKNVIDELGIKLVGYNSISN